jgi:amino acid adenylation domain-containing protein
LFEAQAARTPDAVAVVSGDRHLTYQELNRRANQLAHHLQKLGVGPEVLVGVCVERTLEMVVGLLGILKAGGAYVPLDPLYPQERLTFMLQDTAQTELGAAPVLLTQSHLVERLEHDRHIVCLDTHWKDIEREPATNLATQVTPGNLAYVIYTSGSTGKPKGVTIQHQSLVGYTNTARVEYAITSDDRVLQFSSISFDASAEEIYASLASGAALVLRTDAMLGTVATFLQTCREWGITMLDLPTAYWHELAMGLDSDSATIPSTLRMVAIGGEKALLEHWARWQALAGPRVRLLNMYGPTEATIVSTGTDLSAQSADENLDVSIGRPLANIQTYILDSDLQPVPIGVPGELHIGGIGLARGYHNRRGPTAQNFVPHPFSDEPGARLYKTGDLVRHLPDGNIQFLGRIDRQVKIRGFRIELGEIETLLNQHPDVQETVVTMREDVPGDKRLVAYIVPHNSTPHHHKTNGGHAELSRKLQAYLKKHVPGYMLPSAFVTLDAMPVAASGKVDRRALPAPDRTRPELDEVFVAPRTPTESALAEMWAKLLGIDRVGVTDNFFDVGGHSLLATQLVSRLREAFQVEVPLHYFFETPTVAELAASIETAHWIAQDLQAAPAFVAGGREEGEL